MNVDMDGDDLSLDTDILEFNDAQQHGDEEQKQINDNSYTCKNTKLIGFGNKSFSPHDIERINKLLKQPVMLKDLKERVVAGTDVASYLTGDVMVQRANEIFGVDGWSFQILKLVNDLAEETEYSTKLAYTAVGRITLKDGTTRENVGAGTYSYYGKDFTKLNDKMRTHSNAKKSAITDCIKRTLSLFGVALGLGLSSSSYQNQPLPIESNNVNNIDYNNSLVLNSNNINVNINVNSNNNTKVQTTLPQISSHNIPIKMEQEFSPNSSPNSNGNSSSPDNSVVPAGLNSNISPNKPLPTNKIPNVRFSPYSKPGDSPPPNNINNKPSLKLNRQPTSPNQQTIPIIQ